MAQPRYPSMYQLNTRVWLQALSEALGRPTTLGDVPDAELDRLAALGFDWVWLLGVWQTGEAGRAVSRTNPDWTSGYAQVLPDLREEDVQGSPFAVQQYTVHRAFGGDDALRRLRARLAARGLRLLLDFVPNHTAPDHPWAQARPELYVQGTDADLARAPERYARVMTAAGPRVLAHGRDPYSGGWPDTLQLDYRQAPLRGAMIQQLGKIAELCDGVRCDMAMLILARRFRETWGDDPDPARGADAEWSFWSDAIAAVRQRHPRFLFVAEVYWGHESELQQLGFDFTYDKLLYDRLRNQQADGVKAHLQTDLAALKGEDASARLQEDLAFQARLVRFLENHDEDRAAGAFPGPVHEAAALVTFTLPGLRLIHDGQLEGRRLRLPIHLGRRPAEPVDRSLRAFYAGLLSQLRRPTLRDGAWERLVCRPAWDGNPTWERFLAWKWTGPDQERLVVVVNYGPTQGQCSVSRPFDNLAAGAWTLRDLMHPILAGPPSDPASTAGIYVDLPAWGYHLFEVVRPL